MWLSGRAAGRDSSMLASTSAACRPSPRRALHRCTTPNVKHRAALSQRDVMRKHRREISAARSDGLLLLKGKEIGWSTGFAFRLLFPQSRFGDWSNVEGRGVVRYHGLVVVLPLSRGASPSAAAREYRTLLIDEMTSVGSCRTWGTWLLYAYLSMFH
jgi:hypothetical protein